MPNRWQRGWRLASSAEWLAAAVAALIALALLGVQLTADPATGVTWSDSPFTDEGWSVMGARNRALLGTWATDDWRLFWAQLPFNAVMWLVFELFGVGIVQARLVSLACSVATVGLLTLLLSRRIGPAPALVGGVALATSTLFLYYGRLALLEPMVTFLLVAGFFVLVSRLDARPIVIGAIAGLLLALAIGTKPSAAVPAAGMLIGAIVGGRGIGGIGLRAGAALGVVAVIGAGWLAVVLPQPGLLDTIFRIWPNQSLPGSPWDLGRRVVRFLLDSDQALWLASPLLLAGLAGIGLARARWERLDPPSRVTVAAAAGWFVLSAVVLLVTQYRPNRYIVPLLPPLAVLAAVTWAIGPGWLRERGRPRARPHILAAVMALALVVPGVAALAGWSLGATHRLPAIQAKLLEAVTDGAPIEGRTSPTLAMRVPVPTIVAEFGINAGDLYVERGVRWLLTGPYDEPDWAMLHPEAWSAREVRTCFAWPPESVCLFEVP